MRVIVDYIEGSRMGNRMFQYAFGYILAKQKGCELYHHELMNLGIGHRMPDIGDLHDPVYTRAFGDQYVDMDALLNHEGDIIVNSFVQQSRYYTDHRDELRHQFRIAQDLKPFNPGGLTLHIREGDYTLVNAFLGYDFYEALIESANIEFKYVVIVTDNAECDTVKRLVEKGCMLYSEGACDVFQTQCDSRAIKDLEALICSERLAISQSSFSWWAAFLGDHKEIIFPYKVGMDWWPVAPCSKDIDLYFDFDDNSTKFIL